MNADRLGVGSVHTHTALREGQIKQSHSPYVSLSVTHIKHIHTYKHTHGQKIGGWRVATTCPTLAINASDTDHN